MILYSTSLGVSNTFRTKIGQLVGEGRIEDARSKTILYFVYVFFMTTALTPFILYYSSDLARIFINNEKIIPLVSQCLWIMTTYLYSFMVLYTFFSLFRILNMDRYFFKMITFFFPISAFFFAALFGFAFKLRLKGILIGMSIAKNLISFIFFIKIFWQVDWRATQIVHTSPIDMEDDEDAQPLVAIADKA
jgi:Na+-driven multidrug efflux pump